MAFMPVIREKHANCCGGLQHAGRIVFYGTAACSFNLIKNAVYGIFIFSKIENINGFE